MHKPRFNIVYANNNMTEPRIGPFEVEGVDAEIVWSREEEAGADVVLYWNSYTFHRGRARRRNPEAVRILYMYEPVVVDPLVYSPKVWSRYDHVLTCIDPLVSFGPPFHYFPIIYYELPFRPGYGVTPRTGNHADLTERSRAICQICGDKFSLISCELYSLRREAAEWFAARGTIRMDVYGIPGMKVPNYQGPSENKSETLQMYRYALCFENTYHPVWSRGYITEKIFDCMATGTLPVYYGASNIEDRIDKGCYIDFRDFDSFAELDRFLATMPDKEYLSYVERMKTFVQEHNPQHRYSCHRLYEKAMELWNASSRQASPRKSRQKWPQSYFESLTTRADKMRYAAMWLALKCYRYVYPVFAVLRWSRWAFEKLKRKAGNL